MFANQDENTTKEEPEEVREVSEEDKAKFREVPSSNDPGNLLT